MKKTVEQARKGDKQAYVELIESYSQDLYKVAMGYFGNDDKAADAIQDAIVSGYENIHKLRKPEYFKTWLIRILINKCNSRKRADSRFTSLEAVPEQAYEDSGHANAEFNMVLAQMDEKYRLVLVLHYAEDFTVEQIAQALGISQSAVKSRLRRGRSKMKDIFFKCGMEEAL